MKEVKRNWDFLGEERKRTVIDEIITFFKKERDEQLGMIAAEEILDFFLQAIGNDIYNKGVEEAKTALGARFADLEVDLDLLLRK